MGKGQENPCFYMKMKEIKEFEDLINRTLEEEPNFIP
jgi:hypothetical protein